MRSREQICSQQVHCLSCPISVRVIGKDCRELTAKEIQKIMSEVNDMGYKPKSDSYLMKITKAEIISELRVAEHNFFAMEEGLNNSAKAGMEIADKFEKAKELLKIAVDDFKFLADRACEKNCNCCPLDTDDYCEWKHEKEALKLIGGNENER